MPADDPPPPPAAAGNILRLRWQSCSDTGGESLQDRSFHRRRRSRSVFGLAEEEEPTHCVVLRAGGLLSVLDMERGSEVRPATAPP